MSNATEKLEDDEVRDTLTEDEVANCPACGFGWEPTASTVSMFCRTHQEKDEVSS